MKNNPVIALLLMLSLPLLGWVVSLFADTPPDQSPVAVFLCTNAFVYNLSPGACELGNFFAVLRLTSFVTGLAAVGLATIFVLSSMVALAGRGMLTWIFPRVATLANVLNGLFLLLIGVHLIALLWALYASSTGGTPSYAMLALVAVGVLAGVGRVLSMSMSHKEDWEVVAVEAQRVDARSAPGLMGIVEDAAEQVHAP
ncbi:MAG: hypothetical protein AAFR93_15210, partial [Pseudomonadota bacterium]